MWYQYKMTQHSTLNVRLSKSQLRRLKSGVKHGDKVTLNLSSYGVDDSNDDTNFLHKLLLSDRQVLRLHKVFAKNWSANAKLSKTKLSKMVYWEDSSSYFQ